jgi:hypothetical protein
MGIYNVTKKELLDNLSQNLENHYEILVESMNAPHKPRMFNWRRATHLILNRFTMKPIDMKALDLWNAKPLLPIQEPEMNFLSCDLSGLLSEYLLRVFWQVEIRIDEPDKDIKGPRFEEYLAELIHRYCEAKPLGIRGKVKDAKTGRLVTDVDLCYRIGDFLVMVECKARTINQRFFQGDAVITHSRWNDICEWVDRFDKICQGLSNGTLWSAMMPQAVKLGARYIVPVVCTLTPQYLLDFGDRMILKDSGFAREYVPIPRVCSPIELIYFLTNLRSDEMIKKPFVLEIHDEQEFAGSEPQRF